MINNGVQEDANAPIERLAKVIRDDAPVLLVGAGLSRLVGYPDWNKLIDELIEKFPPFGITIAKNYNERPRADILADIIYDCIPDQEKKRWDGVLGGLFSPNGRGCRTEVHIELLKLGFSGVITTNYDHVMEEAAQYLIYSNIDLSQGVPELPSLTCRPINLRLDDDLHRVQDFLHQIRRCHSNDKNISEILHIHGHYTTPSRLVLRKREYDEHYGKLFTTGSSGERLSEIGGLLSYFFLTTPVIFFGFSMSDAFVCETMTRMWKKFGNNQAGWNMKHYVVLNSDGEQADNEHTNILAQMGVQPVFYEVAEPKGNGEFLNGIINFIDNLRMLVNIKTEASEPIQSEKNNTTGKRKTKFAGGAQSRSSGINDISKRTMLW